MNQEFAKLSTVPPLPKIVTCTSVTKNPSNNL